MIDLRISDQPYIADITFKDGTHRRIDYSASCLSAGFFQFMTGPEGSGLMIFVNADTVAVADFDKSATMMGQA